jgi:GT2 family glycosyltransferase
MGRDRITARIARQLLIVPMRTRRKMDGRAAIVILNWNGREFIRDCLRAALAQTYPLFRIIVVDNQSRDGSRELIQNEFPEVTLVPLPENLHFARGMNAGFREALADPACAFVAALNNDTRIAPDWLAELVRAAEEEGVGMVASKILFMDRPRVLNSAGLSIARDGSAMDRGWNEPDEGQYDDRHGIFGPSAGAALYRREVLKSAGLFDEDFLAYYEDVDLAWRVRLLGWQARFAPQAIVHHKFSASFGQANSLKTYLCERNRIWVLVQNYPWRYAALSTPWNWALVLAGPVPWNGPRKASGPGTEKRTGDSAAPMARARIDGYAGIPRALAKRRLRAATSKVDSATIGRWLRSYGVSLRDKVLA